MIKYIVIKEEPETAHELKIKDIIVKKMTRVFYNERSKQLLYFENDISKLTHLFKLIEDGNT